MNDAVKPLWTVEAEALRAYIHGCFVLSHLHTCCTFPIVPIYNGGVTGFAQREGLIFPSTYRECHAMLIGRCSLART